MKVKQFHSKSSFLKLVALLFIVLAASVTVILATQKKAVFDDSEASSYCANAGQSCGLKDCCPGLKEEKYNGLCRCFGSECDFRSDSARYGSCINNKAVTCTEFGVKKTVDCNKTNGYCVPGANSVVCSAATCAGFTEKCIKGSTSCCAGLKCRYAGNNNYYCLPEATGSVITPNPSRTSTPQSVITCVSPNYCSTRYECSSEGGTIVSGKCGITGEVCCKY